MSIFQLTLIDTILDPPHLHLVIPAQQDHDSKQIHRGMHGTKVTVLSDPSTLDLEACELLPYIKIWNDYVEAWAVSDQADRALSSYLGKAVRLVKLGRQEEGGSVRPASAECSDPRLEYLDSTIAAQGELYHLTRI